MTQTAGSSQRDFLKQVLAAGAAAAGYLFAEMAGAQTSAPGIGHHAAVHPIHMTACPGEGLAASLHPLHRSDSGKP